MLQVRAHEALDDSTHLFRRRLPVADNAADQTTPDDVGSEPVSPAKKRRAKIIILVLLAVVVVGGLVWFMRYQSYGKFQQSTTDAYVQADSVTVAPKISGYVDQVLVAENQTVKAGDPLVRIDARDYNAQAKQSEAQIAVAQANARGVEAQIAEQQAAITRARADLAAHNDGICGDEVQLRSPYFPFNAIEHDFERPRSVRTSNEDAT